ncbi:MAG: hypothetical protein ACXW05_07725 [Gemmatirosa sp.]
MRPTSVRALPLGAIAGWEAAILASIAGASGTMEERHAQIARSGLYGEYPAILAAYQALFAHPESGAEALKRAVFVAWVGSVAPPCHTAILDLPEHALRATVGALERALARGARDDAELRWMLAWYHGLAPALFDVYGSGGGDGSVADAVADCAPDAWLSASLAPAAFMNRGQMGRYWRDLLDGRRVGAGLE